MPDTNTDVHPRPSDDAADLGPAYGPPRRCWMISARMRTERGFIPSLVIEHQPGYTPSVGIGDFAEPWYWGTDWDKACAVCDQANLDDFGLEPDDAAAIVGSSIAASIKQDAAKEQMAQRLRDLGISHA